MLKVLGSVLRNTHNTPIRIAQIHVECTELCWTHKEMAKGQ